MNQENVFHILPGQRQLFLDDEGIAGLGNLTRTMHQPAKKGAVITPDLPWESCLQTRCAPAWDPNEKLFKLWMITGINLPDARSVDGLVETTYAESEDGSHWTKPILRQYEMNGSKENNFVVIPNVDWPADAIANVVYDPDDSDPSRRYKGFGNYTGREPIISPDGIHWKRLDVPPIPSEDESNLSYDPHTRTFIATVKHRGPYGRAVYLSTSQDFEHWSEQELIFHADDLDQELGRENIKTHRANPRLQQPFWNTPEVYNVDVYNMGLFRYEGLYIGMPSMYHAVGAMPMHSNTVGFHLVQLICSRDLKAYRRLGDRKPFIGPSPLGTGAYDLQQIICPSAPVVRGDELWFYYTGLKYRGEFGYEGEMNLDSDRGAICLAVLRRDGFISLDAGAEEGTLLTQPFKLTGSKLYVNADASKGTLQVEILDEQGRDIAISETLDGDRPRGELHWQQGNLTGLQGQVVSLRFTLRNAGLYAYWPDRL